jgi:methanesulfonate monooxygenase small subunit
MFSVIAELVAKSCMFLDEERFEDYLTLFAGSSNYRAVSYSPDLRRDLTLLDLNREELETLLRNLQRHVRLPGRLLRLSGASISGDRRGSDVLVTTPIITVHTDLEGNSKIFAVGRYRDVVREIDGRPLFVEREVRLDTRQFGTGSHVPI